MDRYLLLFDVLRFYQLRPRSVDVPYHYSTLGSTHSEGRVAIADWFLHLKSFTRHICLSVVNLYAAGKLYNEHLAKSLTQKCYILFFSLRTQGLNQI